MTRAEITLLLAFGVAWSVTFWCGQWSDCPAFWLYIHGGLGFAMGRDIGLKLKNSA